jgi:hypothetical protein
VIVHRNDGNVVEVVELVVMPAASGGFHAPKFKSRKKLHVARNRLAITNDARAKMLKSRGYEYVQNFIMMFYDMRGREL